MSEPSENARGAFGGVPEGEVGPLSEPSKKVSVTKRLYGSKITLRVSRIFPAFIRTR